MAKPKPSDILFWVLACASLVLLFGLVLVLAGAVSDDSPESITATEEIAPAEARPATVETKTTPEPATTATEAPRAPPLTTVVITASRGDCWIEARLGSETGRLLYEQVLSRGDSVRLRGRRIWLSVGASGNVGVTVNGKPRALPSGTIEVVLDPSA